MYFARSYILFFVSFLTSGLIMASQPQSDYGKMKSMDIGALNTYVKNMHTQAKVPLPKGYNLLHLAAMLHATDQVYKIIKAKKYDINQCDNEKGFTPLLIACIEDDAAMARVLLSCGASPDIASKKGITPLIKAIQKENISMISILLIYNANVNQKDIVDDNTPLHTAIQWGNSDIVSLLLHYHALPNLDIDYGFTPLMAAAQMDASCKCERTHRIKIVQALLDAKANHEIAYLKDQDTALHIAVGRWHKDVIYLLLKAGADPNALNSKRETPLLQALQNIKRAIKQNDDVAVKQNCFIARLLLLYGAQLSTKELKNKNIDLNAILTSAIQFNVVELVKFSLEAGANANYKNNAGDTPLHLITKRTGKKSQSLIIALLLLGHGADLKLVNREKRNALDNLLQSKCEHICQKL